MLSLDSLTGIFDDLPDGVCLSDADGRLTYLNPAARRLLGLDDAPGARRLCELLCSELVGEGGSVCAAHCPLLREPTSPHSGVSFTGRLRPSGPHSRGLRIRCYKLSSDAGGPAPHLTLLEDVTQVLEGNERRNDLRDSVANVMLDPLSAMVCALEVALGGDGELYPEKRLWLDACLLDAYRMTDLLRLYLDLVRFESGLMSVSTAGVDLTAVARNSLNAHAPLARRRRIILGEDFPGPLDARGDPDLVLRVVKILLDNAIRSSPDEGTVHVRGWAAAGFVLISLADSGSGLRPEELQHAFDLKGQVRRSPAAGEGGLNLGLTYCRRAVEAMGGSIDVSSRPGAGSEFIIRLPALRPERSG